MALFIKSPDAVLDYEVDWSQWLDTDTISTSTFTVDTGLTKDSDSNTQTTTKIVLSGGTAGQTYRITNEITTAAGKTDNRSFTIRVEGK